MHRVTQPVRWGTLVATLVLAMGMAIVWSPSARAAVACDVTDGVLSVELNGGDETLTLDLDAGDAGEIQFSSCADVDLDTDPVDTIDIVGDDDNAEEVTFDEGTEDPWSWAGLFTISIDLGANDDPDDDDSVILEGTDNADTLNAATFASYTDVDLVYVNGGDDNDTITGATSIPNELDGEDDEDTITGGNMDDYIHGGNDEADDTMSGGGGNDTFDECSSETTGDDVINGGNGSRDTVDYSDRSGDVTVILGASGVLTTGNGSDDEDEDDQISFVENAIGGGGDDTLTGNGYANVLNPGASGDDTLTGNGGVDTLEFSLRDFEVMVDLDDDAGNDGSGDQVADDGDGADLTISGFENVVGSTYEDDIEGNNAANVIEGGEDNDDLSGAGGNDVFDEGSDDVSEDEINGGAGTDTVDYSTRPGTDVINIDLSNSDGEDDFDSADVENAVGSAGANDIFGNSLNNSLQGLAGDDYIYGLDGKDNVSGGDGDDWIEGNDGNDKLSGGKGEDELYGYAGDDSLNGGNDGDVDEFAAGESGESKGDLCVLESLAESTATTYAEDTDKDSAAESCEKITPKKYA